MSRKEPAAPLALSCEALPAEFETRRPRKNHTAVFSRNGLIKTLRASPMDAQLHSLSFFSHPLDTASSGLRWRCTRGGDGSVLPAKPLLFQGNSSAWLRVLTQVINGIEVLRKCLFWIQVFLFEERGSGNRTFEELLRVLDNACNDDLFLQWGTGKSLSGKNIRGEMLQNPCRNSPTLKQWLGNV